MPPTTLNELRITVEQTFDYIFALYQEHSGEYEYLRLHDIYELRDAMLKIKPLTPDAQSKLHFALRLVAEKGTNEARQTLYTLYARFRDLLGPSPNRFFSSAIWYLYEPPIVYRGLMPFDVRGRAAGYLTRPLRISGFSVSIDDRDAFLLGQDDTGATVLYDNSYWTYVYGNRDLFEAGLDPARPSSSVLFIPGQYWENEDMTANTIRDATVALRSILEDLGFYQTRAIFTQNIRVHHIRGNVDPHEVSTAGYYTEPLEGPWVPILALVKNPENADEPRASLNRSLLMKPDVAGKALENLITMANTLKQIGVAMLSWDHLMVNVDTGKVTLGEGDRPILMNASLLVNALKALPRQESSIYIPYLATYAQYKIFGIPSSLLADARLQEIIGMLRTVSHTEEPTPHGTLPGALDELRFLDRFLNNDQFHAALERHPDVISWIIENYLEFLGLAGFMPFATLALVLTVTNDRVADWIPATYRHMSALSNNLRRGELTPRQQTTYADRFWMEVFKKMREDGNGGAPQTPSSGGENGANSGGFGGLMGRQAPEMSGIDQEMTAYPVQATPSFDALPLDQNAYNAVSGAFALYRTARELALERAIRWRF